MVTASLLLVLASDVSAQMGATTLAQQSLRPYWHVFIAYTLAWLLVFGWVISLARRFARVEQELQK